MMRVKIIFLFAVLFFLPLNGESREREQNSRNHFLGRINNTEIKTFTPVPFGRYPEIRLVPRADEPEPCLIGTVYMNLSGDLVVCQDNGSGSGMLDSVGAWTRTGNVVYPSGTESGDNIRVGIGTNSPSSSARLHVHNGDMRITAGNLIVEGDATLDDMDVNQDLTVSGNTQINGNWTVNGTTNLGVTNMGSSLTVDGNTTVTNLIVNRGATKTNLANVASSETITINGDLYIDGLLIGNWQCSNCPAGTEPGDPSE